jgi:hypothetical protein
MNTGKYRLQIAFDIKDENNRSILSKETFNATSRSIRMEPTESQAESFRTVIHHALSLCEENPKFRSLFCVKIPDELVTTSACGEREEWLEIPKEFLNYRSLIHSKEDNRLFPFVSKELWINRDIFSKSRLWLRKTRYYLNSLCALIRL